MKYKFPAILSLLLSHGLLKAQDVYTQPTSRMDSVSNFAAVDVEAAFPGDNAAWMEYITKNLKAQVPIRKGAPAGTYQVVIRFLVSKDGSLSDISPETYLGYGMEDEVMRVIRKSPKWAPALQAGKAVNAYRRQPITFIVPSK